MPLHGQPRERWDEGLIRLGVAHLKASQRGKQLNRWHQQACIAAEHALAEAGEPAEAAALTRVLVRQGRRAAAAGWWQRAIDAAGHPAEARMLARVRRCENA